MPENTAVEIAEMQKIARALPESVKIQTYRPLIIKGGAASLSFAAEYGDVIDELTGGAVTNIINKAIVNPIRQAVGQEPVGPYKKPDPMADVQTVERAKTAVQRGGQLSFGLGGVKFTLPELGLSELLGVN